MRGQIHAAVFVGPTLGRNDLTALPCAIEILPPAMQGDIYRLSQFAPKVIGLIDGFYHSVPAVWHKEILWALSQGTLVLGAASIGALRAAELVPFGMRGIGRVFEQFETVDLTDDDEVAVVHGPAEVGYPAVSEAMVNIRATVEGALLAGVLDKEQHDRCISLAKSRHFTERSYAAMFADAASKGQAIPIPAQHWIESHRIDQKRQDALALLQAVAMVLEDEASDEVQTTAFTFEYTSAWEAVRCNHRALDDTPLVGIREILEELALKGQNFARATGVFPVAAPSEPPFLTLSTPTRNPIAQSHDGWMRNLVVRLEQAGAYTELRDRALEKRMMYQSLGASQPIHDQEDMVAHHFVEIDEVPSWFERRAASAWDYDAGFWGEFDVYAQSLGLRDSAEFVRAVVRDRQLCSGNEMGRN